MKSPCVGICTLEGNICIGCDRTIQEISNWGKKMDKEKLNIIVDWMIGSTHIKPQDLIPEAGFPDDYVLTLEEIDYVYSKMDQCSLCGTNVEVGELYDTSIDGLEEAVCDWCYSDRDE